MLEQLKVGFAETGKNIVDLLKQLVGTELGTPAAKVSVCFGSVQRLNSPLEDRMRSGEDTVVDHKVVRGERADELLQGMSAEAR